MTKIKVFLQFLQLILHKACLTRKILQPICYSPCPPPSSLQQHEWPQITVQHTLYTTTPCIVFVYQELTTCLCLLHLALNCPNPPLDWTVYVLTRDDHCACWLHGYPLYIHPFIVMPIQRFACLSIQSTSKRGMGSICSTTPLSIQITVQQNILSKRLRCFVKLKNKGIATTNYKDSTKEHMPLIFTQRQRTVQRSEGGGRLVVVWWA